MKYLFKYSVILFGFSMLAFASCKEEPTVEPPLSVSTLILPANGVSVSLTGQGSSLFEWEPSQRADVTYKVVFDKNTGDFSSPTGSVENVQLTSVNIPHKKLDEIAGLAGIEPGKSGVFKWTVYASTGSESAKAATEHAITIRRIEEAVCEPCDPCHPDYDYNLCKPPGGPKDIAYLYGEGTEAPVEDIENASVMKRTGDGMYEIYTRLEAGKPIYITVCTDFGRQYHFAIEGSASGNLSPDNEKTGGMTAKTSIYRLEINVLKKTYRLVEIQSMNLMHNWSQILFPMHYQGSGVWALYDFPIDNISDGEMDDRYKFRMTAGNTVYEWRAAHRPSDWKPNHPSSASGELYYEMVLESNVAWWTDFQIWKSPSIVGWNMLVYDVELILKPEKPYTHSFAVKGIMPKPDHWTAPASWAAEAQNATQYLINTYWNSNIPNPPNGNGGYYFREYSNSSGNTMGGDYWPQAHSLDVMLDACIRTDNVSTQYFTCAVNWLTGVRHGNGNKWTNSYIDDMDWIALAALRGFEISGDDRFLPAVKDTWYGTNTNVNATDGSAGIRNAWTETGMSGGGVFWNASGSNRQSKNACSNAPAAILAARLYRLFKDTDHPDFGGAKAQENLIFAIKAYDWQKRILVNSQGGVNDNINEANGAISNSVFSYNLGTYIGAAVELYKCTGNETYIMDAVKSANYTMEQKSNLWGILNASGDTNGRGDGSLFNGILIRYMTQLVLCDGLSENDRQRFINYLKDNGVAMLSAAVNPGHLYQYGPSWMKPIPNLGTSALGDGDNRNRFGRNSQLSACMLLEALALLEKENL